VRARARAGERPIEAQCTTEERGAQHEHRWTCSFMSIGGLTPRVGMSMKREPVKQLRVTRVPPELERERKRLPRAIRGSVPSLLQTGCYVCENSWMTPK
jgi:hypothetical protein